MRVKPAGDKGERKGQRKRRSTKVTNTQWMKRHLPFFLSLSLSLSP
jgi:hypothetical protein